MPPDHSGLDTGIRRVVNDGYVHLTGLGLCICGTVTLTKLSSWLAPFNLYFTFSDLVSSGEGGYGFLPFLLKMAIPFCVGALYFAAFKSRDEVTVHAHHTHQRPINLELTAAAGAAFGAILLSWPAIVAWEFIVSPTIFKFRFQFLVVYALYVFSFAVIARSGVMLARLVWIQDASRSEIQKHLTSQYQLIHAAWGLVWALATGGAADWLSKSITPA